MKHFFIICIVLLSCYTYNSPSASELYAFFIPGNAMKQDERLINLEHMHPRHNTKQKSESNNISTRNTNTKFLLNYQEETYYKKDRVLPYRSKKINNIQKIDTSTQPYNSSKSATNEKEVSEKKEIPSNNPPQISSESPLENPIKNTSANETDNKIKRPSSIQEKLKKYKLDDSPDIVKKKIVRTPKEVLSEKEKLVQMTTSELLDRIPYPDNHLPKFKQLYSYYGIELRILKDRGKLPNNLEQEETLAKSNSLSRFEVK